MKSNSAWSRGLLFGSVFGALGIVPVVGALLENAPLNELAIGGGVGVLIWASLGFLAGYASYAEPKGDLSGNLLADQEVSRFRRLLYRFIAGLLLSYLAAMVLCGIDFLGFLALVHWHGGFNAPAMKTSDEEMRMIFIAFAGVFGANAAAVTGCWLGAMLTPGGNQLRPVAKHAFGSAFVAMLAGGWIGGMVGGLHLLPSFDRDVIAILAAIAGALAGIMAAGLVYRQKWLR